MEVRLTKLEDFCEQTEADSMRKEVVLVEDVGGPDWDQAKQ